MGGLTAEAVEPEERGTALALCSLLPLCCGDPLDRCAAFMLRFINFFGCFFLGGDVLRKSVSNMLFIYNIYTQLRYEWVVRIGDASLQDCFVLYFVPTCLNAIRDMDSSWSRAGFYVLYPDGKSVIRKWSSVRHVSYSVTLPETILLVIKSWFYVGFEWIWFATLLAQCLCARWLECQRLPANGASYCGFGPLRAYRLNPDLTSSLDCGLAQMAIKQPPFPSRHLKSCCHIRPTHSLNLQALSLKTRTHKDYDLKD